MKKLSLEERRRLFIESACSTCGGAETGGSDEAPSEPGDSGEDDNELLGKLQKVRDALKKKKKEKVLESKKPRPTIKMILKASQLDMKADEEKDREKKFVLYDRVRKIRSQAHDGT